MKSWVVERMFSKEAERIRPRASAIVFGGFAGFEKEYDSCHGEDGDSSENSREVGERRKVLEDSMTRIVPRKSYSSVKGLT